MGRTGLPVRRGPAVRTAFATLAAAAFAVVAALGGTAREGAGPDRWTFTGTTRGHDTLGCEVSVIVCEKHGRVAHHPAACGTTHDSPRKGAPCPITTSP